MNIHIKRGMESAPLASLIKDLYTFSLGAIYIFMKGLELKRIQHRIGTKVKRVQALVDLKSQGSENVSSSIP